jgi:adenylate cyclase
MSAESISRDKVYRFQSFRLDRRSGLSRLQISGQSTPVVLGSRALDVLSVMAERAGGLVTKQALMEAVWPGTVVEEANLTVQISALRRVLDEGNVGASCIQTIIGRGYRFLPAVTLETEATTTAPPDALPAEPQRQDVVAPAEQMRSGHRRPLSALLALIMVCLGGGALIGWHFADWRTTSPAGIVPATAPRLSMVVLPFRNLGGDASEDYLADAITDDLTTDLAHLAGAFVIARESAYTYKNKATDARQISRELGVRYVLEGSVRKLDTTLRVNVQLIAAETGLLVWSDRFDQDIRNLAEGQQRVVARMWGALGISMVDIEWSRTQRERPTNPDAFDLVLQARAIQNQPVTQQRAAAASALYERALLLDPGSVQALSGAAYLLIDQRMDHGYWTSLEALDRAEKLTAQALAVAPTSEDALRAQGYLLRAQSRWKDATAAAQRFIELFPNNPTGYIVLALCKIHTGRAEEAVPLDQQAIRQNPRHPYLSAAYRRMGFASLMLGRDQEAIAFYERSLALHPDMRALIRQSMLRQMAAAYARLGDDDTARRTLAEADRLWPFDTVRSHSPEDPVSVIPAKQVEAYQSGLRRAGLRDHAEEDADFGVPPDKELHHELAGLTPTTVPGARTIRTQEFVALLGEQKPVVIDVLSNFWGRSVPGAVGLMNAGSGGSLVGAGQDRLRRAISALTGSDLARPIVAVGWNSERFDGRNLALRLVALGYTNVYWYRGGREAWEVNDLPETELAATDW